LLGDEKGAGVMVQTKEPILVPFSEFEVRIRALSPGDEYGLREMLSRLSRESINKRFHLPMPRVPEWTLAYLIDVDHHDKESLVALVGDEIVGQAMYARQEASEAEMAGHPKHHLQTSALGEGVRLPTGEVSCEQVLELIAEQFVA